MRFILFLGLTVLIGNCARQSNDTHYSNPNQILADEVKAETKRAWDAYVKYAWGHDNLRPISGGYDDWYEEPLYISPIDAYSTLHIMGLEDEAKRVENYVVDSLTFDKDIYVKTFEVNIRILGGLLSMYDLTQNPAVLAKAQEFAERMLPAFESESGLPYYSVNLKTGAARGDTICVAEAASYLLEFGVLSYYTKDPKYYQLAKRCSKTIHDSRSPLGLIGQNYRVSTGQPLDSISQVGCFVDSYYEYLYKGWVLFGDEELKKMWENSLEAINQHIADESGDDLWYGIVNAHTGAYLQRHVRLWDAYFPAVLVYAGDTLRSEKSQETWHRLWSKYGLVPTGYDYARDSITGAQYALNPEVIESAYYLWHYTRDQDYMDMLKQYYKDLKTYCRTPLAYAHIENVVDKEKSDNMSTFFFAETMKYLWLAFQDGEVSLDTHVFTTEAHPFVSAHFDRRIIKERLGI